MQLDTRPDFHFLMIAPNLGAEWLFDAARGYWAAFTPIVISDFEFLRLLPPFLSVVVTVVARRDTAPELGVQLAQLAPFAVFDPVVFDLFEETKLALDNRAKDNAPFGVPLVSTMPDGLPTEPAIPTPRLPATRPPSGFITATPTGTPDPTMQPTPSAPPPTAAPPAESGGGPTPIVPTPGPLVGG